jgi:hypothetical protein
VDVPSGLIRLADCLHAHAGPGDRVSFCSKRQPESRI